MAKRVKPPLSPLENAIMRVLWDRSSATADQVRTSLGESQPLNDSTVRTILRRLEQKGYATHTTSGKTFVYEPKIDSRNVAVDAVRAIIDRFCQGSVEDLLVGMVDGEVLSPEKLQALAKQIGEAEESGNRPRRRKKGAT
jgi:predicted transcriptional regulator